MHALFSQFTLHNTSVLLCSHSVCTAMSIPLTRDYVYMSQEQQQMYNHVHYGYGRTTTMATGVLRLWLRVYYDYGYGHTTTEATGERTGVLR